MKYSLMCKFVNAQLSKLYDDWLNKFAFHDINQSEIMLGILSTKPHQRC